MSDSSHHEFSIFDAKHFLASAPAERLKALGLSTATPVPSATEPRRAVSFVSEAYEFPRAAKALLDAVGSKSRLRILSDEQWQCEYPEGDEHWMEIAHYSVVTSPQEMIELATELERILAWCEEQPQAMSDALWGKNSDPANMARYLQDKLSQRVDLSESGGASLGPDIDSNQLLFSVLHTISKMLKRAAVSGQWFDYRSQRYEHSW